MQGTVNGEGVESLQREMQALRLHLTEKEGQVERLVSWVFFCFTLNKLEANPRDCRLEADPFPLPAVCDSLTFRLTCSVKGSSSGILFSASTRLTQLVKYNELTQACLEEAFVYVLNYSNVCNSGHF